MGINYIPISTGGRNLLTSKIMIMYYVYITANWNNKVLYTGATSDLCKRVWEHKQKCVDGFTKKYNVDKLVYFEPGEEMDGVLAREKEIKKWRREKKDELIRSINPDFIDLYQEYCS